jgi:hypothetical protein
MSLYCKECGSSNLRRARFRFYDALRLFALRYPVRCRFCRKRWHAFVLEARLLPNAPPRRQSTAKAS